MSVLLTHPGFIVGLLAFIGAIIFLVLSGVHWERRDKVLSILAFAAGILLLAGVTTSFLAFIGPMLRASA